MPAPFLDADARHPLTRLDGTPHIQTVQLARVIDHPNIEVGDHTYYNDFDPVEDFVARIAPYLYAGAPERLVIGRFCQIAHGTRIITSSADHPKRWFSSYPFAMFNHEVLELYSDEFSKGTDTVIGHDVWIGHGALILPGVTIGNGAIIGAGAVVAHDVAAWSVVAGNPASEVRRRFSPEVAALLERLAWWALPLEDIRALVPVLASADTQALAAAVARLRPEG